MVLIGGEVMAKLTQLGSKVSIPESPEKAQLEVIPITLPEVQRAVVQFSCPEFTSLCPVTGQPDFARIYIQYIPKEFLVESKSLKLYLASFRNHGEFHENCTTRIARKLVDALTPQWLRIYGIWFPRGGIPIDVFWQTSTPPDWAYIPYVDYNTFTGR